MLDPEPPQDADDRLAPGITILAALAAFAPLYLSIWIGTYPAIALGVLAGAAVIWAGGKYVGARLKEEAGLKGEEKQKREGS